MMALVAPVPVVFEPLNIIETASVENCIEYVMLLVVAGASKKSPLAIVAQSMFCAD